MAEALEAIMLICFGLSWPMNAYKNFKARTAAGTSWQFILLITLGYFAGIAAKFVSKRRMRKTLWRKRVPLANGCRRPHLHGRFKHSLRSRGRWPISIYEPFRKAA